MKIPLYQVDAFTSKIFNGNPAAVCPLEDWIDDDIMQKIAQENNLSETSFFIKNKKNNSGSIYFEYKDIDQLNRLIDVIKQNY